MTPAERDLGNLLAKTQPILRAETYVFYTIPKDGHIPGTLRPVQSFREEEGTALIVTLAEAENTGLSFQFRSRMITLKPSRLSIPWAFSPPL
jgi:hypothetical protein